VHHGAASEVDRAFLKIQPASAVDFIGAWPAPPVFAAPSAAAASAFTASEIASGPAQYQTMCAIGSRSASPEWDEQCDRRELHASAKAPTMRAGDRREGHLEAEVDQLRDIGVDAEIAAFESGVTPIRKALEKPPMKSNRPVKARL